MNTWRIKKEGRTKTNVNLCLTSALNLFIILIPFLLVTAVFINTSVIDMKLPTTHAEYKGKENDMLILAILVDGFYLVLSDNLISYIPKEQAYNYARLRNDLTKIKTKYPSKEDIIIKADDRIIYDYLVQAMDECRLCGIPNITLAATQD
ncbi:MAG: ExbD/TolR family protein [bacterium]